MNVSIPNRITGKSFLTTERSESSYGIPVLVTASGVYGPGDRLFPENDELSWMHEEIITAADLINKVILTQERFLEETQESYNERMEAARLFLSPINGN